MSENVEGLWRPLANVLDRAAELDPVQRDLLARSLLFARFGKPAPAPALTHLRGYAQVAYDDVLLRLRDADETSPAQVAELDRRVEELVRAWLT